MILLYITNGINGSGGLERVLSVKASYLADHYNYQVHILVLNNTHQNPFYEFSDQIKYHSISVGGNPMQYWKSYKRGIRKVVNEVQPNIISVCDDGLKGFFVPQFLKTNARIIYERHVSKLIEARDNQNLFKNTLTKFKWFLMEKLAKSYDRFIVLTEGNKKEWHSLKNMQAIENPLPFESEVISSYQNRTVICVGKISYQKGQDLLSKSWEIVHSKYPAWELHLYGKENINFYDTNNLNHNIHYFQPEKNIGEKYLNSSIYVMSSRFEGFGMVLIEAMEYGLPCVSFDCDYGPADIIDDGVDGYIVEKENTDELAQKLINLIEDEKLRKQMGRKAKENVKRYSAEEVVKKWDDLFKSLIVG